MVVTGGRFVPVFGKVDCWKDYLGVVEVNCEEGNIYLL